MKYRVKKGHRITYPDGSLRGERGYIVDGSRHYERPTLEDFADALEPTERQAKVSPVNVQRLWSEPIPEPAPQPKAKATKKKVLRKKAKKAAEQEEGA